MVTGVRVSSAAAAGENSPAGRLSLPSVFSSSCAGAAPQEAREISRRRADRKANVFFHGVTHPFSKGMITGTKRKNRYKLITICGNLLTQGRAVRYLMWRDQINRLKTFTEPEERDALLKAYKTADVLYIDDFLKCGRNEEPTKADLDVALEVIMARYNQPGKLTVISTERSVEELLDLDEALGSRVFERSKGHYLRFTGTDKNWRLRR